jgi:hypothetical protein
MTIRSGNIPMLLFGPPVSLISLPDSLFPLQGIERKLLVYNAKSALKAGRKRKFPAGREYQGPPAAASASRNL